MKDLKLSKEQRIKRVIARGEHSNHSHVLFGDVQFLEDCFKVESSKDYDKAESRYRKYSADLMELMIKYGFDIESPEIFDKTQQGFQNEKKILQGIYNQDIESMDTASIRHILETSWVNNSISTWTEEHIHAPLKEGTYKYISQVETNPLNGLIRETRD